jgi:hypothetical protein
MFFAVIENNGTTIVKQGFLSPEDALTFVTENYPSCDNYAINEEDEEQELFEEDKGSFKELMENVNKSYEEDIED